MPRPNSTLHDFQKRAISRMIAEPELALFMDMGLGKTAISLFAIKRLIVTGKIRNCVIVAPIRVVHSVWRQEAMAWDYTRDLSFTVLHGGEKNGRYVGSRNIYLVNYEGLQWFTDRLRQDVSRKIRRFDMIIFDESSKMKSPKTKRFKQIKGLIKMFKRRYILTATPTPNHLMDIWSQFYIMDAGETLGTAFGNFQRKYFYEARRYVWIPHDHTKKELHRLLAPKVTRLKAEDYLTLPDISYQTISVDLPEALRDQYNAFENDLFMELDDVEMEVFNAAALSMKLRQFIQGAMYYNEGMDYKHIHDIKLTALTQLLDEQDGQPVIVPTQFRFEREILTKKFKHAKVIAGGTSPELADQYINQWNAGDLELLIVHPASISHGVNLQAGGHLMIWYGLTWSLEEYTQLIGRLHRQGQPKHVIIHHIVMDGTVDNVVLRAIQNKASTQAELLDAMREYRAKVVEDRS